MHSRLSLLESIPTLILIPLRILPSCRPGGRAGIRLRIGLKERRDNEIGGLTILSLQYCRQQTLADV